MSSESDLRRVLQSLLRERDLAATLDAVHQVLQPGAGGELPQGPEGGDACGGQIEGGEARQEVQQPRAHLGERVRGQVEVAQARQRWQAGEGGQAVLRQVQDLEGAGALLECGWQV